MSAARSLLLLSLTVTWMSTTSALFEEKRGVDCIKCPASFNGDDSESRRKRSFGGTPGFDFSMSMGDVVDDLHSFSMSFQDEFDAFGGLFPGFSRFPAPTSHFWWQGPNVCVREETKTTTTSPSETFVVENAGIKIYGASGGQSTGTLHFRTSYCVSSANSYKCNTEIGNSTSKTITSEIHECCQGFARVEDDDQPGCNKELNLGNLEETIDKLGLGKLKDALASVGLLEIVKTQNMTIFAPTDEAMAKYEQEERSKLASYAPIEEPRVDLGSNILVGGAPVGLNRHPLILDESIRGEVKNIETTILGHLVPGFLRSSSLADEQLVETANGQAKMRINMYEHEGLPKKLVTANCAPVTSADHQALNGVIHIVDRIVKPPTKGSLMDMIASDPDFSILKSLIGQAGLTGLLRDDGSLSIFAPTNDAFNKLPPKILKRLTRGKGDVCVRRILETHILSSVICSSAIAGEQPVLVHNKLNNHLNASRVDDKVFVGKERAQVTVGDVMASNGVMHVIDAVLLPREGVDLVDAARKSEGATFADLVSQKEFGGKDGLAERLENAANLTVFVPSDEAFKKMDGNLMDELLKDSAKLEAVLKHHVVPDSTIDCVRDLSEGKPLRTMNLKNPLHIQELNVWPHGRVRTVQCANIISRPIKGCNGNIVLVDKVLIPPEGNVIDVLALNGNLTRLVGLLKTAGLADELQGEGPFTIFAPNDEAFGSMRQEILRKLEQDPVLLKTFLRNHVAQGVTCCSLIRHGSYMGSGSIRIPSLAAQENRGNQLRLHSFHGMHNFVNHAQILECDAVASNGVVHVINDVLKPRELQRPNSRHHSMDSFFRRIFDGFHLRDHPRRRGFGQTRRDDFFQMP